MSCDPCIIPECDGIALKRGGRCSRCEIAHLRHRLEEEAQAVAAATSRADEAERRCGEALREADASRSLALRAERERDAAVARAEKALEHAAKEADAEAALYEQNAKECDAAGNHLSATRDIHGVLACQAVARRIRALSAAPKGAPRGETATTWPEKTLTRCPKRNGEDDPHAIEQVLRGFGVWTHDDDMSVPEPAAIFADEADAAAWLKRCQDDPEDGRGTGDTAILPVAVRLYWNNCYCAPGGERGEAGHG